MSNILCVLFIFLYAVVMRAADDPGQTTNAPAPYITYNETLQVGTTGYVSWDLNAFSGNVSVWIQQNYPNASVPQIPLNLNTDLGYMVWAVGTNVDPGQYYYELQLTSGEGIVYKSNPFSIICATCPLPTSTTATATTTSSSVSHLSYSSTHAASTSASTTSAPPEALPPSTSSSSSDINPGAAAGIGVGSAAAAAIIAISIWLLIRYRRRGHQQQSQQQTQQSIVPPQQWTQGPPPPEMTTYTSAPPYKQPSFHDRQLSHELQNSEIGAARAPSESAHSHMYSPPRSPQPVNTQQPLSTSPGTVAPHHLSPLPSNQPWFPHTRTGSTDASLAGSPQLSYEGSPRSNNQDGVFENTSNPLHGSPESQQGFFPRRPVGGGYDRSYTR